MLKKSILILFLGITIFSQGCGNNKKDKQNTKEHIAVSSNKFVLTSTDNKQYVVKKEGNGFTVEGQKGKVIIFDIFATWCPPCQASASHLTSLQKKYKDNLIVIAITVEENINNEKLEKFKKDYGANYIMVNSDKNRPLINEISNALELGKRFPIPIMALYLDAKPINHYIGKVQEEFVESDIKRALHL